VLFLQEKLFLDGLLGLDGALLFLNVLLEGGKLVHEIDVIDLCIFDGNVLTGAINRFDIVDSKILLLL
jgi:hypothetical protein